MATYGELFQVGAGRYYGDYGLGTCASAINYTFGYIGQQGGTSGDAYQVFTEPSCAVTVHADQANVGTDTNMIAFWPTGSSPIDDSTVTSIIESEGNPARQGHVHRVVQAGNRLTGIAVIKDITGGASWRFGVYLFDSAQALQPLPLLQIGSTATFPLLQADQFNAKPYPWVMKTRLIGDELTVKVWPEAEAEPAWTDTTNTATFTIAPVAPGPYQTSISGLSGWLAGGLTPGSSTSFTGLSVTPEAHAAKFTGQRRSFTATDLLDLADGVGQVHLSFRFEIVDSRNNYQFEVYPPKSSSMSIRVDTESVVKRTLDGFKLSPYDARLVDPFSHRLRPVLKLETGDEWELGVFLFDDKNLEHNSRGTGLASQLTDQTTIIDQPRLGNYSIPPGGSIYKHTLNILNRFRVQYIIPSRSPVVAKHPLSWKAGDSAYVILTKLFLLMHWYPPYFDNRGFLRGKPVPSREDSRLAHVYTTGNLALASGQDGHVDPIPSRIFDNSLTESDDLVRAPNRYVITSPQTTGPPLRGIYEIPITAPHSRRNRGYFVDHYESINGLKSEAQARKIAENRALYDLNNHRWYEFSSLPDPRHDIFDRVLLNGELCVEVGHTMTLAPHGPHSHKVRRLW